MKPNKDGKKDKKDDFFPTAEMMAEWIRISEEILERASRGEKIEFV